MVKKSKKTKPQPFNKEDQNQEQLDDLLAWGNKRQNYYKDGDDQYSSISEEQAQANKIYDNHYEHLNEEQYYGQQNQAQSQQGQIESQEDQNTGIQPQYLKKEIKWTLKQCQTHVQTTTQIKSLLQKMLHTYLLICLSLKELKVPYVSQHPIVNHMFYLKSNIMILLKKIKKEKKNKVKNYIVEDQSFNEEDKFVDKNKDLQRLQEDEAQQFVKKTKDSLGDGLKLYQDLKRQNKKKSKKLLVDQDFKMPKKPAFELIEQNQARLASQLILKNKGLVKKRKKIDGNSRVKLRKRYAKAISNQRARGHFIRQNPGRLYQGQTNLRFGKIASIKIK